MKKASAIIRIIASCLIFVVGIVIILAGVLGYGFYYYGYDTFYEFYGDDVATGIQHATAEISSNIKMTGYGLQHFVNNTYCYAGILISLIGIYLFALSLLGLKKEASSHSVYDSTFLNIENYKKLLDKGIITQEEFEAKKKQLLGL